MSKVVTPFRVGLLVILTAVVFAVSFTFVHKGGLSPKDSLITWAYFHDASGLGPKSRVQIAGIEVGQVQSISLEGTRARVTLLIKREIPVKVDAKLEKRSESLLGDFELDLAPGSPDAAPMPNGGQIVNVQDQTGVEQIFGSLSKITADIQDVTSALRGSLGGPQGATSLQHIIANLSQMSDQLNETIRVSGERIDAITGNFKGVSEDIRALTGGEEDRYKAIVANVERITQDIQDVLASVKKALGTGEGNVHDTVASLKETLDKLDQSLDNVQQITNKVNKGDGTIGQLINDKRLGQALTDTVVDASDYVGRLTRMETEISLRSEYLFNAQQAKNYLSLRLIPAPDKYYTFEIVDDPKGYVTQQVVQNNPAGPLQATEQLQTLTTQTLKFTAEFNKRFYFATVHFGVIESTGGAGLDLHFLEDALTLKFEAFDFSPLNRDYPHLKSSLNYAILGHVFFTGGADDWINAPVRDPVTRDLVAGRDFFLGGGFYFTDDDLKAVLSAAPKP